MYRTAGLVTGLVIGATLGLPHHGIRAEPPPTTESIPTAPTSADVSGPIRIADAVGVYPLSDDLATRLVGYEDFLAVIDAAGEFVVWPDGTVAGALEYTVTQGIDNIVVGATTFERTFAPASLEITGNRLGFTTDVETNIVQDDQLFQGDAETATGTIDGGVLVVTGLFDLESVRFELDPSAEPTVTTTVAGPLPNEPPTTAEPVRPPTTVAATDEESAATAETSSDSPSTGRLIAVFATTCVIAAGVTIYGKRRRTT